MLYYTSRQTIEQCDNLKSVKDAMWTIAFIDDIRNWADDVLFYSTTSSVIAVLYKWANNWTSINVFYFPDQLFFINTIENNGVSGNKAFTEIILFVNMLKDQILSFYYSCQPQSAVEHIEVHSRIPTTLLLGAIVLIGMKYEL